MSDTMSLPTYSAVYAFGDSLSDAGNDYIVTSSLDETTPISPPYALEQYGDTSAAVFSNGPTWVQDLSIALNLGTLAPSLAGGNDYAFGGAQTGDTAENPETPEEQAIDLSNQLTQFQAGPTPLAGALYTLSVGANDIISLMENTSLSADQMMTGIDAAVTTEVNFLGTLAAGGATDFLVMNVPDLGKTPEVMNGLDGSFTPSAQIDAEASQLSASYDTALANALGTLAAAGSLDIRIVDAYSLIDNAIANPGSYGLTNVTVPVWSGNFTDASSGTLSSTDPAVQNQSLFFDELHPTETGHLALAGLAENVLSGAAPCYAAGTRIATASGAVAVEDLRAGMQLILAHGDNATMTCAPVTWIGQRRVDCRRHPRPWDVMPVRIMAGAFGPGVPVRDLRLSPDHAVLIDGVLIPVRYLLNGVTIVQEEVAAVTYFHIELARHAVILAEGLAAESYLDTGNRAAFANGGAAAALHPDFARRVWAAEACATLVTDGPELQAARSVLLERAGAMGYALADNAAPRLLAGDSFVVPEKNGSVYRFRLPGPVSEVRLVSPSGVPAEMYDDSGDTRRLGIAIARLWRDGVPVALDDARLGAGWHQPEDGWRWTDGGGALRLDGARVLDIEIVMAERHWVRECEIGERAA